MVPRSVENFGDEPDDKTFFEDVSMYEQNSEDSFNNSDVINTSKEYWKV